MKKLFLIPFTLLLCPTDGLTTGNSRPPTILELVQAAGAWAFSAILSAEAIGGAGGQKLTLAAEDFGKQLCAYVNSLEARAGVLGGLLNSAGADAIEHTIVMRALESGGELLQDLLKRAVQGVFNTQRQAGNI